MKATPFLMFQGQGQQALALYREAFPDFALLLLKEHPEDYVAISGEAREYARATDSGNTYTTGFCPGCGSTLYGKASGFPGVVGLTVGTISQPGFARPTRSVYEQSRHHWVAMPAETQGFVRGRDGERTR